MNYYYYYCFTIKILGGSREVIKGLQVLMALASLSLETCSIPERFKVFKQHFPTQYKDTKCVYSTIQF